MIAEDYYGLVIPKDHSSIRRPKGTAKANGQTSKDRSVSRKNRSSKEKLWWVGFMKEQPKDKVQCKVFLNDYQLIEEASKSQFKWKENLQQRPRTGSIKKILYRRLPHENTTPRHSRQPSDSSSRQKITVQALQQPSRQNLSDIQTNPKYPSHSMSTRSMERNANPKENPEPSNVTFQSSTKAIKEPVNKNEVIGSKNQKRSVIREEPDSDGVPSIVRGNKMMDSKESTVRVSKITLKKSLNSNRNSMMLSIHSRRSSQTMGVSSCELEGYIMIDSCLQTLNVLAQYSQGIVESYQDVGDWDELIFLVYKKFYLERKKLIEAIKLKDYSFFSDAQMNLSKSKQFKDFFNSNECRELRLDLERENIKIVESLRNLYNLAIEKSGQYVNMLENDNFSHRVFVLMAEEIEELQPLFELNREEVIQRVKSTLTCAATLCHLNRLDEQQKELRKLINQQVTKSYFAKVLSFFEAQLIQE